MSAIDCDAILDFKQKFQDVKAKSLREYFKALLVNLWSEGEGFSGKRPFGNSGWDYDVYTALAKSGAIEATFDEGYIKEFDQTKADKLVFVLIDHCFKAASK